MKRLPAAVLMLISLFFTSAGRAAEPAPEKKLIDSKKLADALVEVGGDQDSWSRGAGLLAFALEIGITEEQFRLGQPGNDFDKLPAPVLSAIRQHVGAIDAWAGCFGDKREMRMIENDLFGGGSSEAAKKTTCEQAAFIMFVNILPAGIDTEEEESKESALERLAKSAKEWTKPLQGKSADERMKAWFELADDHQRRKFLAIAIQFKHKPAYPLLEANFIERAKAPDKFLYLELGAYFRHRRAEGKKLYEQLATELHKQPFKGGPQEWKNFYLEMWKMLTDYNTFDAAIADWHAGKLRHEKLQQFLQMSIDQPWAYHSMGIEPTSVFVPTMEHNLKAIVAAASKEQELPRRVDLLELGTEASKLLRTVINRTNKLEQGPPPRSDAPAWQLFVGQLRELFKDDRLWFDGIAYSRPGELAADIVWDLWKDTRQEYDAKTDRYLRNWQRETIEYWADSAPMLKIPAAESLLAHPENVPLAEFPQQQATAIVAKFKAGNAAAWRKQLAALSWEERLMFLKENMYDKQLPFHIWPRLIEFVAWTGPQQNPPESFARLWQEKLADKKLDETSWKALKEWLVAEARAKRYWSILGESSPAQPGITLHVVYSPPWSVNKENAPVLQTILTSKDFDLRTRPQTFRIAADALEEITDANGDRAEEIPLPMDAIQHQNTLQEGSFEICRQGFMLQMIVAPPGEK